MINSIDLTVRLSLFSLSGYTISTLDKYDLEPDIRLVSKEGIQRAFCTFCGNEVKNFDPAFEGQDNHDHFCDLFQKHIDQKLN